MSKLELMWIQVEATSPIVVGVLYHPKHSYPDTELLDHIEFMLEVHLSTYSTDDVIIGGDFNSLKVSEVTACTSLVPLVNAPIRGNKILDMLMAPADSAYQVKVITSAVQSDHEAILATCGTPMGQNKMPKSSYLQAPYPWTTCQHAADVLCFQRRGPAV